MPRPSRASRRSLVTGSGSGLAFPDRLSTVLTYADNAQTAGVPTYATRYWALNSVYDPDATGAGHQPRFFDQYAAIYARYLVTKVEVNIAVRQRVSHGIGLVVLPTNGIPTLTPSLFPAEFRRASFPVITSSNQPPAVYAATLHPHAIAGVTREVYMADDRFQSGVGSNPTEVMNLGAYMYSLDATTSLDVEWSTVLKYHVDFFDLAVPGPSILARAGAARESVPPAPARVEGPVASVVVADPQNAGVLIGSGWFRV